MTNILVPSVVSLGDEERLEDPGLYLSGYAKEKELRFPITDTE